MLCEVTDSGVCGRSNAILWEMHPKNCSATFSEQNSKSKFILTPWFWEVFFPQNMTFFCNLPWTPNITVFSAILEFCQWFLLFSSETSTFKSGKSYTFWLHCSVRKFKFYFQICCGYKSLWQILPLFRVSFSLSVNKDSSIFKLLWEAKMYFSVYKTKILFEMRSAITVCY